MKEKVLRSLVYAGKAVVEATGKCPGQVAEIGRAKPVAIR